MTHERHFSNEDPAIGAGTPDEREFRRDVFVTPSWRYADPRRNLLMQAALDQHRADGYSVRQEDEASSSSTTSRRASLPRPSTTRR